MQIPIKADVENARSPLASLPPDRERPLVLVQLLYGLQARHRHVRQPIDRHTTQTQTKSVGFVRIARDAGH